MFTGIIEEIGKIQTVDNSGNSKIFTVLAKNILENKKIGGSISVNGACMTIVQIENGHFKFETLNETLKKTNLCKLKNGNLVNLESPLTLQKPIDGHLVLGHIDEMAEVHTVKKEKGDKVIKIKTPKNLNKYLALKGSITVNGVSLTISHLEENFFSVNLISHTLKCTNLGNMKKGDFINLEIDMLARYLKRLLDDKEKETTYEFLKERNFI